MGFYLSTLKQYNMFALHFAARFNLLLLYIPPTDPEISREYVAYSDAHFEILRECIAEAEKGLKKSFFLCVCFSEKKMPF